MVSAVPVHSLRYLLGTTTQGNPQADADGGIHLPGVSRCRRGCSAGGCNVISFRSRKAIRLSFVEPYSWHSVFGDLSSTRNSDFLLGVANRPPKIADSIPKASAKRSEPSPTKKQDQYENEHKDVRRLKQLFDHPFAPLCKGPRNE